MLYTNEVVRAYRRCSFFVIIHHHVPINNFFSIHFKWFCFSFFLLARVPPPLRPYAFHKSKQNTIRSVLQYLRDPAADTKKQKTLNKHHYYSIAHQTITNNLLKKNYFCCCWAHHCCQKTSFFRGGLGAAAVKKYIERRLQTKLTDCVRGGLSWFLKGHYYTSRLNDGAACRYDYVLLLGVRRGGGS